MEKQKRKNKVKGVRVMALMPLSTIFQLYRGGQFLLVEETTNLPQVTDKLYHINVISSTRRHEHKIKGKPFHLHIYWYVSF